MAKSKDNLFWYAIVLVLFIIIFTSFLQSGEFGDSSSTYVSPSIDYRGKYRSGHVRKAVSSSPNAIQNRLKNKAYYERRGKYLRKRKK